MKKLRSLTLLLIISAQLFSQQIGQVDSALVSRTALYFQPEYNLDQPTDIAAWQKQSRGLHISFASTNKAYFRAEVPNVPTEQRSLQLAGWKGERISTMLLLWSPDSINQIRFELSDLKDHNGNVVPKANIDLELVRYVISNYPYDAKDVYCGDAQMSKLFLMPDRFEKFGRFDLPGKTTRPIWVSINIPTTTKPGPYKGKIIAKSEKQSIFLDVEVQVQNQTLPKPADWSFRLDLWQNPYATACYSDVKPWSPEHLAMLRKHLKLYADAGGKFITANVIHAVWADETYGSLVEWIRRANGSWKFDYTAFDRYVAVAIATGITKAITIYSPIPYGMFRYVDEKSGNYVYENWPPTSDSFRTNWTAFLADLQKHLQQKGWFDKTYIGINENGPEQTLAAIRMVRSQSANWKITYAGDWHVNLDSLLDDYSSIIGKEPSPAEEAKRRSRNVSSTFYVCCTPPKPNNFVFSPPVEGQWIGWYASAHGYSGFLRWAYDTWPTDVIHDARNTHWNGGAGDCYMVYPGGNSSVRFEKLREGIVDFEKIRIIRQLATRSHDPQVRQLFSELTALLQVIDLEKEYTSSRLEEQILRGKNLIQQLSDKLAQPR